MTAQRISHYLLGSKLGEGGMGIVYAAYDERLCRDVALKTIRAGGGDVDRKRLWREARSAAGVSHPNVCQLYEIGEDAGEVFIAMELLKGETLASRIKSGPLDPREAVNIGLSMLSALQALHTKHLVHRDLKPGNVFLSEHGVKLLDFGLTQSAITDTGTTGTQLTAVGQYAGTPSYMSPEQLSGQPAGPQSDLFAAGCVLFEMLTGRPAFSGRTLAEVWHAIGFERPPALAGSPDIVAVDRVIHRALAKQPAARYPSAAAMADELKLALLVGHTGEEPGIRTVTRLIVLPFRVLRRDEDTEFLAFSLPDAITSSLAGLQSLVVRSSLMGVRYAAAAPDLKTLAIEADVDAVLTGTLVRYGDEVRITTELVEAPAGTLVWSHAAQTHLGDVFRWQDELVHRIVESLSVPLTAREHRLLRRDVPASGLAYELYLRANEVYYDWDKMALARDLYLRSVQEDPRYAPAWARLGRCHRLLAKWSDSPGESMALAQSAFERALSLNPDLPIGHCLYAQLESDLGRPRNAMIRLLGRARISSSDPDVFAGLTHACRYCGLLEASLASHERARRLDPQVRTSVAHTHFAMRDYSRVLETSSGGDFLYIHPLALAALGREREARELLRARLRQEIALPGIRLFGSSLLALFEGKRDESVRDALQFTGGAFRDPEGLYYFSRQLSHLGDHARALSTLRQSIAGGYGALPVLRSDPWLDPLRESAAFNEAIAGVESDYLVTSAAFMEAEGDRSLLVQLA